MSFQNIKLFSRTWRQTASKTYSLVLCILSAFQVLIPTVASAGCSQWGIPNNQMVIKQDDPNVTITVQISWNGTSFTGLATMPPGHGGKVSGFLRGDRFNLTLDWGNAKGLYTAVVSPGGNFVDGRVNDLEHRSHWANWASPTVSNCLAP
jgi:hypothetical protein